MSADKAFCLSCMIFGGPLANQAWAFDSWNDWVNGIRAIDRHEMNKEHKAADVAHFQWISAKCVSVHMQEKLPVFIRWSFH